MRGPVSPIYGQEHQAGVAMMITLTRNERIRLLAAASMWKWQKKLLVKLHLGKDETLLILSGLAV
jgi:hypothetical protein